VNRFMVNLKICYRYGQESHGYVQRTLCVPWCPTCLLPHMCTIDLVHGTVHLVWEEGQMPVVGHMIHVTPFVMENMVSCTIRPREYTSYVSGKNSTMLKKRPREYEHPFPVNLCAKVFATGSRCELTEPCQRMKLAQRRNGKINKGELLDTPLSLNPCSCMQCDDSGFDAGMEISTLGKVMLAGADSDQGNMIRIVGAYDMKLVMDVISRLCNVDKETPPLLNMAILKAATPHSTLMGGYSCTLQENLAWLRKYANMGTEHPFFSYQFTPDFMEQCMVDLVLFRWRSLAESLDKISPQTVSRVEKWESMLNPLDHVTRGILENTQMTIKITHFGNVKLHFTWTHERGGPLPWVQETARVANFMVLMAMQLLEVCT